jgi:hypothetical protein
LVPHVVGHEPHDFGSLSQSVHTMSFGSVMHAIVPFVQGHDDVGQKPHTPALHGAPL